MKSLKKLITIRGMLFLFLIPQLSLSQNLDSLFLQRSEIYFSFKFKNKNQLKIASEVISLDHKVNSETAYAYANKKEFAEFLKLEIQYLIKDDIPKQYVNGSISNWDYYPTYQEYVDMMMNFSTQFPEICKTYSLGTLSSGREILIVQISRNVSQKEDEPSFLYTSSMHGNELTGYILCLRLIDHLLNGYGNDTILTNLVNQIDIWINPLANPDGAYAGGNQDVWSATRYNNNLVDLNRNYPDPEDGLHPDGNPYQAETNIFIGLSDTIDFTISANIHSGAEVCNYPWDTWSSLAADDSWWQYVSSEYADSCQANSGSGYFDYLNNGITNGNDWYEVNGGRQDYMNYYKNCREFTLEISDEKIPDPNELPELWDANHSSLLNYMQQSLYGLRGIITDSITGKPIRAKVEILGHDLDNSHVYSSLPIGNYHRYLIQSNYDISFSKTGYHTKTINTTILNNTSSVLNVQLAQINPTSTKVVNSNLLNDENKLVNLLGIEKNKRKNSIHITTGRTGISEKKIILE
tara:strand:- start:73 stop:1638 length:1566 start_codon:yes stop_codon:yes gene_type:complete